MLRWAILSFDQSCFAADGDSGSCIWSLDGRAAGMLDGGSGGQNGKFDITYATSLDLVFRRFNWYYGYSSVT